jgi:hypothetical protein
MNDIAVNKKVSSAKQLKVLKRSGYPALADSWNEEEETCKDEEEFGFGIFSKKGLKVVVLISYNLVPRFYTSRGILSELRSAGAALSGIKQHDDAGERLLPLGDPHCSVKHVMTHDFGSMH